jgi:hypothetical protein
MFDLIEGDVDVTSHDVMRHENDPLLWRLGLNAAPPLRLWDRTPSRPLDVRSRRSSLLIY